MASTQQDDHFHTSPGLIQPLPASLAISPLRFLTVPNTRHPRRSSSSPQPDYIIQEGPDALLIPEVPEEQPRESFKLDIDISPPKTTPTSIGTQSIETSRPIPLSERTYMSVYSSSSADTELSEFSNPPARRYRVPNPSKMPRKITPVC
jgi:hypothetical protein